MTNQPPATHLRPENLLTQTPNVLMASCPFTGSTPSPTVPDSGINFVIRVALRAVSFFSGVRAAPSDIIGMSYWFKMFRPCAVTIGTAFSFNMINLHAIGNRAYKVLVGKTVSIHDLILKSKLPISFLSTVPRPDHASVGTTGVDFSPEALFISFHKSILTGWGL